MPTLFFIDPWGYKGLSLRLVNSVLKHWACECIFFFNFNRVNMGFGNPAVKEHIDSLFGEERGKQVRELIDGARPEEREVTIMEALAEALCEFRKFWPVAFRKFWPVPEDWPWQAKLNSQEI